jgi:hypothetical protein
MSMRMVPAPRATALALASAALLLVAPAMSGVLGAQGTPRHAQDPWRAPRVLKWTLLAASAGLGLWAYRESNRADDDYERLRSLCLSEPARCTLSSGRYADDGAESLYRSSNAGDRRARLGLLAGEATLLGSAAFFIVDLRHGGPPDNIPYHPPAAAGARFRAGLRIALP